jgi:Bacterial Ig domain
MNHLASLLITALAIVSSAAGQVLRDGMREESTGQLLPAWESRPLVKNIEALSVGHHSALLTAMVDARSAEAMVTISYTDPMGNTVSLPAGSVAVDGYKSSLVQAQVDSLQPYTTYRFRVAAANAVGTTTLESEFKTSSTEIVAMTDSFHTPSRSEPFTLAVKANDLDGNGTAVVRLPQPNEAGYDPLAHITTDGQTITYYPNILFYGNAYFYYILTDGVKDVSKAIVFLHNLPPSASNHIIVMDVAAQSVSIDLSPLVIDPDGDPMSFDVGASFFGNVKISGDQITYVPSPNFSGYDEFPYGAGDARGGAGGARIFVKLNDSKKKILQLSNNVRPDGLREVWKSFGTPTILESGYLTGWLATLGTPSGRHHAIFMEHQLIPREQPSHISRLLRTGARAFDERGHFIPNTFYTHFDQPLFAQNTVAFRGRIEGPGVYSDNQVGIWVSEPFSVRFRLIAREGDKAPGTDGSRFAELQSMVMPSPWSVFFTAKLETGRGGVTTKSDRGLWVWNAQGATVKALCEGQFVEDAGQVARISSFRVFSSVRGSPGHNRYDSSRESVDALVHFDNGKAAIMSVDSNGQLTVTRRIGQEENGLVLLKCGMPASPGSGKRPIAAVEFAYPGAVSTRYRGIINFEHDNFHALAGQRAPETESETFLDFKDPVAGLMGTNSNPTTVLAFEALLAGSPRNANTGIWSAIGEDELRLVARKGMPAPGADGMLFREFQSLSTVDNFGPFFTACLSPGDIRGCWATDSSGALRLLLRTGETIEGRTVRSFHVLTSVRGSEGQRRSWAGTAYGAKVVFRVVFEDAREALITASIP